MTIQIEVNNEGMYVTRENLVFRNIVVPRGFVFDGVTVKAPFRFIFTNDELRRGIRASCFHDYMCKHKLQYRRSYATQILCECWRRDGLPQFKTLIVKWCVNFYQSFIKGWD